MVSEARVELWPIDKLVFYARNPRKNDAAVDRMCSSIREFGFKIPVLARSGGEVVDGHLRLKAARKLGITEDLMVAARTGKTRLLGEGSRNYKTRFQIASDFTAKADLHPAVDPVIKLLGVGDCDIDPPVARQVEQRDQEIIEQLGGVVLVGPLR